MKTFILLLSILLLVVFNPFRGELDYSKTEIVKAIPEEPVILSQNKQHFIKSKKKDIDFDSMISILKIVETQNDSNAIGDNGMSFGILQIQKKCVQDVNRSYKTSFSHKDMFIITNAEKVFKMYVKLGIKRYKKRYGKMPSEKRIVQMWNFGIYQTPYDNGYYKKYLKIKNS